MRPGRKFTPIMLSIALCLFLLSGLNTTDAGHTGFHVQTGRLLVASEKMTDPRFAESVILLIQHNPSGTLGLILNNRSNLLPEQLPPEVLQGIRHIYFGGPVEPLAASILVFGKQPPGESKKILTDVHLTQLGELVDLIGQGEKVRFRMFLGYSGWAPGQLEMELAHGAWQVHPADGRILFQENVDKLWQQLQESGPVISL